MNTEKSKTAFDEAKKYIPGGVNSPVRAFANVVDFKTACKSDTERFKKYFNEMLKRGIYLAPSQFESLFLSDAHTAEDLEKTVKAFRSVMEIL